MMEYFQLKDRILSAMIEHFTYDSTSALEVPYPCIIELTFYFRIQPFYHHDLVHMDYVFHKWYPFQCRPFLLPSMFVHK